MFLYAVKSDALFLIFYPYLCSRFKKQYGKEEHRFYYKSYIWNPK